MDKLQKSIDSEGAECTCASPEEHEAMVREVDASFAKDDERARMRTERNVDYLRARVIEELSKTNGQNYSKY